MNSAQFDRLMSNEMANLSRTKFKFETDPLKRGRIRRKLLRKIENLVDEYAVRIGQQACVLTFYRRDNILQIFGAEPLKQVLEDYSPTIKQELNRKNARPSRERDPNKLELPELEVNGELRTINQLTQANLRSFIPLLLKYASGRGKPGWGVPELKPTWWPDIAPWTNVRSDTRTIEQKQIYSWTTVLREIVKSCYRHFEQEELLYENDETRLDIQVNNPQSMNNSTTDKAESTPNPFYCESLLHETNENTNSINENQQTKSEAIINIMIESVKPSTSTSFPIIHASFLNEDRPATDYDIINITDYCKGIGITKFYLKTEFGELFVDG